MSAHTPWLSVDEIAKHLGVSKDTIYNWINQRNMPAHKVGRFWKFQAPEVDTWIRSGGAADQIAEPADTERRP